MNLSYQIHEQAELPSGEVAYLNHVQDMGNLI